MEGVAVLADRSFSVTLKIDCNIILVAEASRHVMGDSTQEEQT